MNWIEGLRVRKLASYLLTWQDKVSKQGHIFKVTEEGSKVGPRLYALESNAISVIHFCTP